MEALALSEHNSFPHDIRSAGDLPTVDAHLWNHVILNPKPQSLDLYFRCNLNVLATEDAP